MTYIASKAIFEEIIELNIMSKLDRWIDQKILQNLFIWFFLYLILLTTIQAENRITTSLFIILLLAPSVYINNLIILPFLKKRIPIFFVLFVLNVLLFSGISVFIINRVTEQPFKWNSYVNFLGIMVLAMVFASAIKLARDSFTRRQQEKEAELKLLKAQLNPHFLFNTLNNLYGLSVVKSDKLPSLMLKLSDLLRYSLYETRETYVSLEKEIMYLDNYIALEKIRLEDSTAIQFTKTGGLSSIQIAPMLLIVFVENAFKHLGASNHEKSAVTVTIKKANESLFFTCTNSIDLNQSIEPNLEKGKSGIGLENARKRLTIIYPENHQLDIHKNSNSYTVELTLHL